MVKNVIVLNEFGEHVSYTYPKRAKGLVKSGRAEYINDTSIRMLIAQDPTISYSDNMEDFKMSNVICFNTREFQFDKTCQGNNVGSRMFITDSFGKNIEVFEIGNGSADWTQICSEKILERNTDYVFRFAMSRKSTTLDDGVSQFIIVPIKDNEDEAWDNRYTFNLARGEYKPLYNKNIEGKNVKVYEIPFNTYDVERFRFVFVEQFSVTRVYTAEDNEVYAGYPDADRSFFEETKSQFESFIPKDINVGETLSKGAESLKNAFDKISATVINTAKTAYNDFHSSPNKKSYNGENLNASALFEDLAVMNDGESLKFFGCNISNDTSEMHSGTRADGINISAIGCNLGGQIFAGFVTKMGDGSDLECTGSNIGNYFGNVVDLGGPVDGVNVNLSGSNISESSFARLMSYMGDGCKVDISNAVISEEDGDFWYGNKADGIVVNATNATVSDKVLYKISEKFGDGCVLNK